MLESIFTVFIFVIVSVAVFICMHMWQRKRRAVRAAGMPGRSNASLEACSTAPHHGFSQYDYEILRAWVEAFAARRCADGEHVYLLGVAVTATTTDEVIRALRRVYVQSCYENVADLIRHLTAANLPRQSNELFESFESCSIGSDSSDRAIFPDMPHSQAPDPAGYGLPPIRHSRNIRIRDA